MAGRLGTACGVTLRILCGLTLALLAAGCGDTARLSIADGTGPMPALQAPRTSLLPTVVIAPARGWPENATPTAAEGLEVRAFARGLDHPRWLLALPNGDVLVAESNAPARSETKFSLRGWFMAKVMKRAGAGVPSADRITLLRDADGDGVAESRSTFISGLRSPFGMALIGGSLYVANTDAILRFPYRAGETHIDARGVPLLPLPAGAINHHWTKNIIADASGTRLYATVGSNSNIGENGLAEETARAAIWEIDVSSGAHRLFAQGLRNPNGLAWEPTTGQLWVVVNERDELGSDLVPDYMTAVQPGGFYGWPWSYFGAHVDERVAPPRPDRVAAALVPDYALGPHTAPLGLASSENATLLPNHRSGMFIGQHGSWNRKPRSGYRVIYVPFSAGRPSGPPVDVLTGFVDADGDARGRPVGVAVHRSGALLVADDVGNAIWHVTALSVR
jgi:glucose/arabinose dehydrogenase